MGQAEDAPSDGEDLGVVKVGLVSKAFLDGARRGMAACWGQWELDHMFLPCTHRCAHVTAENMPLRAPVSSTRRKGLMLGIPRCRRGIMHVGFEWGTGGHPSCPVSGMYMPEFANEEYKEMFGQPRANSIHGKLSQIMGVRSSDRGKVLAAYGVGMDVFKYVIGLTFLMYTKLLLLIAGLSHRDESVARQVGHKRRRQYEATRNSIQHRKEVLALMGEGSTALSREFGVFCSDVSRKESPISKKIMVLLRCIPASEFSAERLHKYGSDVAKEAPTHTAA